LKTYFDFIGYPVLYTQASPRQQPMVLNK